MSKKITERPKVSIVVPIYNVEKYLRECIDSILRQTLKEIEIILVDDGSPDKSGKIIDEYAKKDSRVVAVHQKNAGYSAAVNLGIDMARGEYIGIIESDDWIESDMYESLYESAKKYSTDVTKGGFYVYNSSLSGAAQDTVFCNAAGADLRLAPNGAFKLSDWPKIIAIHASIWAAIYRADFVKKIKIPETAGASYQDFPFMVETMCKAEKISVVKRQFVHWRNDPGQGNSTSARGKKLLLMPKNSARALEIVKDSGLYEKVKEAMLAHLIWANIGFFYKIEWKYKKEYYKLVHDLLNEFEDDSDIHFTMLGTHDKKFYDLMVRDSWGSIVMRMWMSKLKRLVQKVLLKISPTYRATIHIKERVEECIHQNNHIIGEIQDLRKDLK